MKSTVSLDRERPIDRWRQAAATANAEGAFEARRLQFKRLSKEFENSLNNKSVRKHFYEPIAKLLCEGEPALRSEWFAKLPQDKRDQISEMWKNYELALDALPSAARDVLKPCEWTLLEGASRRSYDYGSSQQDTSR